MSTGNRVFDDLIGVAVCVVAVGVFIVAMRVWDQLWRDD